MEDVLFMPLPPVQKTKGEALSKAGKLVMIESPGQPKRPHFYDELPKTGDWNRFRRVPMKPIVVCYQPGGLYYLPSKIAGATPTIRIYPDGAVCDDRSKRRKFLSKREIGHALSAAQANSKFIN